MPDIDAILDYIFPARKPLKKAAQGDAAPTPPAGQNTDELKKRIAETIIQRKKSPEMEALSKPTPKTPPKAGK